MSKGVKAITAISEIREAYGSDKWLMERIDQINDFLTDFDSLFPPNESSTEPVMYSKAELFLGFASPDHKILEWAKDYKALTNSDQETLRISYHLYKKLGMPPSGFTKKRWQKEIDELLEIIGDDEQIFSDLIQKAVDMMLEGKTIASPASLLKTARGIRNVRNLKPERKVLIIQ